MESPFRIIWFEKLDSTSNEARRRLDELDNLSVVAAVEQFSGRGQRGNIWYSDPGENLTFSVLLKREEGSPLTRIPHSREFSVSEMTALSVRDYLAFRGASPVIKWPNDILVGGRKICGILIENSLTQSGLDWSILGIGINLCQKEFPPTSYGAVSLSMITGKEYSPKEELEVFLGFLWERMSFTDIDAMHEEYAKGLASRQ